LCAPDSTPIPLSAAATTHQSDPLATLRNRSVSTGHSSSEIASTTSSVVSDENNAREIFPNSHYYDDFLIQVVIPSLGHARQLTIRYHEAPREYIPDLASLVKRTIERNLSSIQIAVLPCLRSIEEQVIGFTALLHCTRLRAFEIPGSLTNPKYRDAFIALVNSNGATLEQLKVTIEDGGITQLQVQAMFRVVRMYPQSLHMASSRAICV
jgi:hypothetical protein